MTATAVATNGGIRVQVPAALAAKAQYLQVLVAKIKNAAVTAVRNAVTFVKRIWSTIPPKSAATAVAIATSTRAGYSALTGLVRGAIQFVTKNWTRIENAVHVATDKFGIFIASIVTRVNKTAGEKLGDINSKFTDLRWNAMTRVRAAFAGFGNMFHNAFNSDLTVRTVTGTATAVSVGIALDTVFAGAVAGYAAQVPVIGAALAAIVSGGTTALIALAAAAVAGAAISLFNTNGKEAVMAFLKPAWRFVKGESVVTYSDANGEVIVENAASIEEATRAATAHVQANIDEMQALVRGGHGKRH